MRLSIVTSLYQSSAHVEEFYHRASKAANELFGTDFEVVFVNDGSPDDSLDIVLSLKKKNDNIKIIDLSRNFGHHKALMTGMAHAEGELVFLLDCDLEELPEWLITFHELMIDKVSDVVFGFQEDRRGGAFERVSGDFFYRFINFLAGAQLPRNPTVARLMTKRYVDALLLHKERELYIGGLMYLTGFAQCPIQVKKRTGSETTYTFRKKVAATVNSITSLSFKPLEYIFYLGISIAFLSFLVSLWIVIRVLLIEETLPGWASLTVSIWVVCGLLMSSIGVLGIYISKIFSEVKNRPYTIVRKVYSSKKQ